MRISVWSSDVCSSDLSPARSEVLPAIEQSWLWVTDVEVLRLHYAYTIEHWYARARAARDRIVALYDERFYRMWTFYLAGAITAFRNDGHCRSEEHTSELQSLMRISYAVFCLKKKKYNNTANICKTTDSHCMNK